MHLGVIGRKTSLPSLTRIFGKHRLNIRSGTVSSLPVKNAVQLVEVTQKIAQGMSGGPLLDAHQNVIGINHKGGPEMARDFAVHIKELTAWLAE